MTFNASTIVRLSSGGVACTSACSTFEQLSLLRGTTAVRAWFVSEKLGTAREVWLNHNHGGGVCVAGQLITHAESCFWFESPD